MKGGNSHPSMKTRIKAAALSIYRINVTNETAARPKRRSSGGRAALSTPFDTRLPREYYKRRLLVHALRHIAGRLNPPRGVRHACPTRRERVTINGTEYQKVR